MRRNYVFLELSFSLDLVSQADAPIKQTMLQRLFLKTDKEIYK